jgi:predicted nucleic acid-binding protein
LAEIDHVLERRAGRDVAELVLADFRRGAYRVHWWEQALVDSVEALDAERRLGVGLVDASLIALAAHLGTRRVATLDQRHFRRARAERPFTPLPADA